MKGTRIKTTVRFHVTPIGISSKDAGTGEARGGRGHGLTQEDLQLEASVTHCKSRLMRSHLKLSVEIKLITPIKN